MYFLSVRKGTFNMEKLRYWIIVKEKKSCDLRLWIVSSELRVKYLLSEACLCSEREAFT